MKTATHVSLCATLLLLSMFAVGSQISSVSGASTTHPGVPGCFVVVNGTEWRKTECGSAPLFPLLPSIVGNGADYMAQSASSLIGSSNGSFKSVSGLTSESDSLQGANYYTLQDNTNVFTTSTTYTGGKSAYGWEQFVYANYPSFGSGIAFIQYWLIDYALLYGACPSTSPPGGTLWQVALGSCVANGPTFTGIPLQPATQLSALKLDSFANSNGNDEVGLCTGGTCYTVIETSQVLNLYQHWNDSEFNVFGFGDGSQANFNTGTSMTVVNNLNVPPSCVSGGFTGETNNLTLGSCKVNGNEMDFNQSNPIRTTSPYSLSSAYGPPGELVAVTGSNLAPGKAITVEFNGVVVSKSCFADDSGTLGNCAFVVPRLPAGKYTVAISDPYTLGFTIVPSVTLSPVSGPRGLSVTARGSGFAALRAVSLTSFGSSGPVPFVAPCTTSSQGMFTCRFKVPSSPYGMQTLTFSDGTDSAMATFTVSNELLSCGSATIVVGVHDVCRLNVVGLRPTGTVTWAVVGGSFSRSQCTLVAASCSVVFTPSATVSFGVITATYSGDANNPRNQTSIVVTVIPKPTAVALSCNPTSVVAGSLTIITCVAKVSGFLPTGNVSWYQSGIGTVFFSSASCTLSPTANPNVAACSIAMLGNTAGKVTVRATYIGDSDNLGGSRTAALTIKV